jgi:hypothetical protein
MKLARSAMMGMVVMSSLAGCSSNQNGESNSLSVNSEKMACADITDAGIGDFEFKQICIGEKTAVATVGTFESSHYFYDVKASKELKNTLELSPDKIRNKTAKPLVVMLKVKPDYRVKSVVEALTAKGIELPGAGGRVWVVGHPNRDFNTEESTFIAGDFKVSK